MQPLHHDKYWVLLLCLMTGTISMAFAPVPSHPSTRAWQPSLSASSDDNFSMFPPPQSGKGNQDDEELSDEELASAMGDWDDRIARFNSIHLTGRIGNDPEPRYFDDGKVVVNLGLATQRKYHSMERRELDLKYGEEETDWFNLEIWGQTAVRTRK